MLEKNPQKRISVEEIKSHSWMKSYKRRKRFLDWDNSDSDLEENNLQNKSKSLLLPQTTNKNLFKKVCESPNVGCLSDIDEEKSDLNKCISKFTN